MVAPPRNDPTAEVSSDVAQALSLPCRDSSRHSSPLDILPEPSVNSGRMSTHIDLLQGTLDMLILRTLLFGPAHGHAIAHSIERSSDDVLQVEHGSLYPALHRLVRQGLISAKDGTSENNRKAKFYSLTAKGRKHLTDGKLQVGPPDSSHRPHHAPRRGDMTGVGGLSACSRASARLFASAFKAPSDSRRRNPRLPGPRNQRQPVRRHVPRRSPPSRPPKTRPRAPRKRGHPSRDPRPRPYSSSSASGRTCVTARTCSAKTPASR